MIRRKIYIHRILTFLATIIVFYSCEEVIDVDLKDAEPKIVIEANLSDVLGAQEVRITETVPFKANSAVKNVSGASVTITDQTGKSYAFTEVTSGLYLSEPFGGDYGISYKLDVSVNGKHYQSISVMPQRVVLDSVLVTEISLFDEKRKFVKAFYQEPPQPGNAYRFIVKNNGTPYKGFFVADDRFTNGRYINDVIFTDEPQIKEGDELEIEFQSITTDVYRYFFAISQISGGGGPPVSGGNPDSNISNGALGYFSVHTSQKMNFVVSGR